MILGLLLALSQTLYLHLLYPPFPPSGLLSLPPSPPPSLSEEVPKLNELVPMFPRLNRAKRPHWNVTYGGLVRLPPIDLNQVFQGLETRNNEFQSP